MPSQEKKQAEVSQDKTPQTVYAAPEVKKAGAVSKITRMS